METIDSGLATTSTLILGAKMSKDYYEELEINRNATDAEIKKGYRRLALKFHPSSNREAGSWERFSRLGEAYDVLSDPRKKANYDVFGEEGLKGGIPLAHGSSGAWTSKYVYHGHPEKTFRQFFGGDNPFADFFTTEKPLKPGVVKTQDPPIERNLCLSLEDLFFGCIKKIKISRRVMNEAGHTSSIKDKILSINITPGLREGAKIIFPKEGDQGPNSIPADIVFIIREKPHPLFKRSADDLIYVDKISLEMALTGFSVEVKTLDDRLLVVPVNVVVNPVYTIVMEGEGMPLPEDPKQRGNLIISFDIQFPETIPAEGKHLLRQLLTFKH